MALQTEKNILELFMRFIADTDTDENYFGINFFVADADRVVLCSLKGGAQQITINVEIILIS